MQILIQWQFSHCHLAKSIVNLFDLTAQFSPLIFFFFFFFCTLKRALSAAHLYPRRKIALQRNPFHCIRNGVSQLTSSLTQSIGQTINYLLFTHPSRLTCNIFTTLFFARKLRQSEKEKCSK